MSASIKATHEAAAAAYERHISDNWDRLQPFEQEQARAYFAAKELAAQQPASSRYQQPGLADPDPLYGGMYGGLGLSSRREEEGTWAVPVGYIGAVLLPLLGIGCGVYNLNKGRTGHGVAQILLTIVLFFFALMAMMPAR